MVIPWVNVVKNKFTHFGIVKLFQKNIYANQSLQNLRRGLLHNLDLFTVNNVTMLLVEKCAYMQSKLLSSFYLLYLVKDL